MGGPSGGALLGADPPSEALRGKIREVLAALFDEEPTRVLAKGACVASRLLPRQEQQRRRGDAALAGAEPTGPNGRQSERALGPLRRGAPPFKNAISRIGGQPRSVFDEWRRRSLAHRDLRSLSLDAVALKVRVVRKVVRLPVPMVLWVKR